MKKFILLLLLTISINLQGQTIQKEILLIGTFHFDNPGLDAAQVKSFDVLSEKSQKELETITSKIKNYNPDKIFVEWAYNNQPELDSLYNLYISGEFNSYVERKKYPKRKFYKQNEIFQLAFRAAKKLNHAKIYGIDYKRTSFPMDSLMTAINNANQTDLKKEMEKTLQEYERKINADRNKLSLTKLILQENKDDLRKFDKGIYLTLFNRGGGENDFVGAYLVSEWYKRNLFMYSLVQKITESKDRKIVVLLGSSHVAMFKEFIELDSKFKVVELKEILK